ncbi:NB-ARC domain-containing protein [Nostoc sp.]|uniref:NB-ARC domain-containing protein n=1 Tax=Nostoc sp. TaxID=1180 RepID=UPI002FFA1DCD
MTIKPQKILILAANPKQTGRLRVDEELRDIKEGLQRSLNREKFELRYDLAVRPRDIRRAILDYRPNIIHFSGHGAGVKGLAFEDETGLEQLVTGEALAGLFGQFFNQVECVLLNACYSQVQAEAIAQHINYVIGMNEQIQDKAAIEFVVGFYDALLAYNPEYDSGSPVEFAFNIARNAIELAGVSGKSIPEIKKKINLTPHHRPLGNLTNVLEIPQNLPLSGVVNFVGREEELQNLHQLLQVNKQVTIAIAAIAGMGGVGKTELALQYAKAHLETYKGGICWLLAKTGDVGIQVVQFARTQLDLNPPENLTEDSQKKLLAQVEYCWRHWRQDDVLLVLDDVSDYEQVKPYLQSLPSRFKVLMTTRQNLGRITPLSLDVLQPEAALELLRSLLKETLERIERELALANQLCEWLGYLPLGLELVGRYLARKQDLSLTKMLRRLENKRLDERSLSKSKLEADMTAQRGVLAAFELSWQELEDNDKQLGCLLSLFAAAPIPWNLVEQCLPEEDAEDLEEIRDDTLLNLHLLQRKGEGVYQLHPLLREFFQYKLTGLEQAEEFKRSLCRVMVEVTQSIPDSPTQKFIRSVKDAIPHLAEVAQNLTDVVSDENLIWLFMGLHRFYFGQGLYALTQPWGEQCVSLVRRSLEKTHRHYATSLNNLANIYYFQKCYEKAEPLYEEVLAIEPI